MSQHDFATKPDRTTKVRSWFVTWNNYPDDIIDRLNKPNSHVKWYVCGFELCPTTGTPHAHLVINLTEPQRINWLKKNVLGDNTPHCERVGNQEKCIEYCKKDGNFKESKTVPGQGQGKRNDLEAAINTLKNAKGNIKQVCDEHAKTYVKFHQGLEKLATHINAPQYRKELKVYWLYGATGTGKSKWFYDNIMAENSETTWVCFDEAYKWFDGYCGQRVVLFEDFRSDLIKFNYLLRLLDVYPMTVQIKGATTSWNPYEIYITCPYPPDSPKLFKGSQENIVQLLRRITEVRYFPKRDAPWVRVPHVKYENDMYVQVVIGSDTLTPTEVSRFRGIMALEDTDTPIDLSQDDDTPPLPSQNEDNNDNDEIVNPFGDYATHYVHSSPKRFKHNSIFDDSEDESEESYIESSPTF